MDEEPISWNMFVTRCAGVPVEHEIDAPQDLCSIYLKPRKGLPVRRIRNWLHDELDAQYDLTSLSEDGEIKFVRIRLRNERDCIRFALTWK